MFAGLDGQAEAIEREAAVAFDEDVFEFEEGWMLRWGQNRRVASQRRFLFALGVIATVILGLTSRQMPALLPSTLGKYPGDALWAIMVFFAWGFLKPASSTSRLALYSLITSYADEFSQIYQAPWINGIRRTFVGHLMLGSVFSWWDMLAYTTGVGAIVAGKLLFEMFCQSGGRMADVS